MLREGVFDSSLVDKVLFVNYFVLNIIVSDLYEFSKLLDLVHCSLADLYYLCTLYFYYFIKKCIFNVNQQQLG